jgi:hypothetical protein
MKFDILGFCDEYLVDIISNNDKWINVSCPFCGDKDNLGFNIRNSYFNCWECGFHTIKDFVAETLGMNPASEEVRKAYLKYSSKEEFKTHTKMLDALKKELTDIKNDIKLPIEASKNISVKMKKYLESRGFDADHLIEKYRLMDTPNLYGNLQRRILIPIIYNKKIVSYTARDYSGKSDLRYISCEKDLESIPHKSILYNLDNCKERWCIINEGIFDCWKLGGDNCCAVFGISYKQSQVNLIAKRFDSVCIYFDNDREAIKQAQKLSDDLTVLGVKTIVYRYNRYEDAGEIPIDEAKEIYEKLKSMLLEAKR